MNSNDSVHSIVSLGEVLWDLFPDGKRFGGAPANFACHIAIQGGNVTMLSAVGTDASGDEALRILQRSGVNTLQIQRRENAATGAVGVTIDALGKPSFIIHPNAAWDSIQWTQEMESTVARANAVYFGTLGQRCAQSRTTIRQALAIAKTHRIRRILDVNLRTPFFDDAMILDSISMASILKLSDDEFPAVMKACGVDSNSHHEDALRILLDRFELDLIAMTRGAAGALLMSANETVDQPGFPAVVRDTVGAGDAFTAALAMGVCSGASLRFIAENACRIASAACEYSGAVPS